MKTITIEGREIAIRSLTRQEIKDMKDLGYTYFGPRITFDNYDQAQDAVFEKVLSPDDIAFLGTVSPKVGNEVLKEIHNETYGVPEEEKNSAGTSDGTQTQKE